MLVLYWFEFIFFKQKPAYEVLSCLFFFQAEDGIRDTSVTGVQTCALPILTARACMYYNCVLRDLPLRF